MTADVIIQSLPALAGLRAELEEELLERILPYWMEHAIDVVHGGFAGLVLADGSVSSDAPKGAILNARILWTFSAAYAALGKEDFLTMANRGAEYFGAHFLDPIHGGVFWMVDATGGPADDRKHVYAQAFAIYALAEHHRATGDAESLRRAVAIFTLVETHAHDRVFGGYTEAFSRDWVALDDVRLGEDDIDAPKSVNTHLHLLEAYTTLFRAWPDPRLRVRLVELVELFVTTLVGEHGTHAQQFFTADWTHVGGMVSFGHDIETSWLVLEASDAIGDTLLRARAKQMCLRLATSVLDEGFDADGGGLFYAADAAGSVDTDKEWWPQAEGIVGFVIAYIESGNDAFLEAAMKTWAFTRRYIRDFDGGEWYRRVSREGHVKPGYERIGPWKCPYHNARACLEIMARIDSRASA